MKKKNKYITFHLFELEALAEYFETMASQGWMLKKLSYDLLQFEKCEPQSVHFHLNIYTKGSYMHTQKISKEEQEYCDFLNEYGYHSVCTYSNYQVFMTTQDDIMPIDTGGNDILDKAKLKTIYKYEMYHYGIHAIYFTLLAILQLFFANINLFTSTFSLLMLFGLIIFAFFAWRQVIPFINWLFHKETYHVNCADLLQRERNTKSVGYISVCTICILFIANFDKLNYFITIIALFLSSYLFFYFLIDTILVHISKKNLKLYTIVITLIATLLIHVNFICPFIPNPHDFESQITKKTPLSYEIMYPQIESDTYDTSIYREQSGTVFLIKSFYAENLQSEGHEGVPKHLDYDFYTITAPYLEDYLTNLIIFRYQTPTLKDSGESWKWYEDEFQTQYIQKANHVLVLQNTVIEKERVLELIHMFEM